MDNFVKRLENIRNLDVLIDAKIAERDELRTKAESITGLKFSDVGFGGTNKINRPVENAVVKIMSLEEELNQLIDRLVSEKDMVIRVLDDICKSHPLEYAVLHRRFIRGMTWGQIGNDLGRDRTSIWRIYQRALRLI